MKNLTAFSGTVSNKMEIILFQNFKTSLACMEQTNKPSEHGQHDIMTSKAK